MTEKQIDDKLREIGSNIESILKQVNHPQAIATTFDEKWGTRNITLYIRLDEIAIENLENSIPELKKLVGEYKKYRHMERELLNVNNIDRAIRNSLFPSNGITH